MKVRLSAAVIALMTLNMLKEHKHKQTIKSEPEQVLKRTGVLKF